MKFWTETTSLISIIVFTSIGYLMLFRFYSLKFITIGEFIASATAMAVLLGVIHGVINGIVERKSNGIKRP